MCTLRNTVVLAFVAIAIMLILEVARLWAAAASVDYKPIAAVLGIGSMLVISAIAWRKMNNVARWYLIAALLGGTFMILIALR
jgi:hypothetical protein